MYVCRREILPEEGKFVWFYLFGTPPLGVTVHKSKVRAAVMLTLGLFRAEVADVPLLRGIAGDIFRGGLKVTVVQRLRLIHQEDTVGGAIHSRQTNIIQVPIHAITEGLALLEGVR